MPLQIDTRLVPIGHLPHHPFPVPSPLGALSVLPGKWVGTGFNQIFRPKSQGLDNTLQLNITEETLEFTEIGGSIPNRGMVQGDVFLFGMTYLQQVADRNVTDAQGKPAGIHVEPGIWVNVPATTDPAEAATVARLATIPHGTSLVAQGTTSVIQGAPQFGTVDITPFVVGPQGQPGQKIPFPSMTLSQDNNDRIPALSSDAAAFGITQQMIQNPNSVLDAALAGKTIASHTRIHVRTSSQPESPATSNDPADLNPVPNVGGGVANIGFLDGAAGRPNAHVPSMRATFWISDFVDADGHHGTLLQYSQVVQLVFNGLSWPHVSVASLIKQQHGPVIKGIKDIDVAVQRQFPPDPIGPVAVGPAGHAGPAGVELRHHHG